MGKRRQELTKSALEIARIELDNTLSENERLDKVRTSLVKARPSFQEFMILDDLVQEFIEKIKKGEIKNER